ncbi:Arabinogalactan endo-1,4-beta-galactosidase [Phytophthora cinnamomi]|uniref:Arabinogalactan endo-1,4-beta-galactosidase n=1 Tax=Phytophthora cinnamomi TaxID=4785 RepID=UPI003559507F|nr:Arabinogalactan endo-1,4-beta-galactosidase [Phytophthora cinnamomi]
MFLKTALLFAGACVAGVLNTATAALTNGHDLSSVAIMETAEGAHWISTSGNTTTIETILGEGGMQAVRLRIWTAGDYDLNYTLAQAQRYSKAGFKIYLDMHFSDTWADPHHQNIPAAWDNSSVETLAADLQAYVTSTLQAFTDGGIDLDILSLGNEITIGFLWPTGKLTTDNYNDFATLWKASRQGVTDAVAAGTKKPQIMIHVDNGWDYDYVSKFFTGLFANGTVTPDDVDVLGFSFYPFYGEEATIDALKSSLTQIANDYNKPVYVAETDWPVACENVTLSADYPVSPEGQVQWVNAIKEVLEGLPNGLGGGIFYWEPAYIKVASLGSSCASALLFDVDWTNWPLTRATAFSSVNMFV